jgi:type I restriction enzyme S subunit
VGSIGIAESKEHEGIVSPDYVVFSCTEKILPEYLFYFLKSDLGLEAINRNASGTVRKRLYYSDLARIEIYLPEIDKQIEIIESLNKIEKIVSQLQNPLRKKGIDQLKQSILQEAIQGKLTEYWRTQHPDTDPASELLKRIKAEKAKLIKEGKIKKENPLPPITKNEIPFELPEGWVWCRLGEIAHLITKGSSPKWQGVSYVESGVLFITSENVGTNEILFDKKKYVEEKFNEIEPRSILEYGDILTNIVGASIGRTAIWKEQIVANINQAVCLIRFSHSSIDKQYLVNILNSDFGIQLMMENQFDTGRGNLSMGEITKFKIPFPPLEEQKAIVQKVETLMEKCRALKAEITQSEQHAQMLMQAVLKEAFEPKKEEASGAKINYKIEEEMRMAAEPE